MNEIICEAIAQKRLLQFSYDDLTRVVEPHLFGRKTSGKDALSAYMIDGYSESDKETVLAKLFGREDGIRYYARRNFSCGARRI